MTETGTYVRRDVFPKATGRSRPPAKVPPTDFLVARPNFLIGVASALDLFGVLPSYNKSPSPEAADAHALRSDWAAIGNELWRALQSKRREVEEQQPRLFEL